LDQAVSTPIALNASDAPGGFGAVLLHGGGGADTLTLDTSGAAAAGGKGNDLLSLTASDGTFQFKSGDGEDRVLGSSGVKRLRFEDDVSSESVTARRATAADNPLTPRDLVISYGEADENGLQASFLVEDTSRSVEQSYEFADFVFLNHVQLLEQSGLNLDWLGSAQGEGVQGTKFDDLLDGQGGDDLLEGRDGSDTLAGGEGSDTLRGEAGSEPLRNAECGG
jgi:Ca2+-binding RTX toxin-like protein